jgi:hypothetical protein
MWKAHSECIYSTVDKYNVGLQIWNSGSGPARQIMMATRQHVYWRGGTRGDGRADWGPAATLAPGQRSLIACHLGYRGDDRQQTSLIPTLTTPFSLLLPPWRRLTWDLLGSLSSSLGSLVLALITRIDESTPAGSLASFLGPSDIGKTD